MRSIRTGLLGALSLVLVAIGAADAQELKLRIAYASPFNTYCAPYLVGKELGWFRADGLDITDIIMNGDANATRALVTGAADVAMTGPLNVFNAIENSAQIKWIGSWQNTVDYVVAASVRIKSLAELTDKIFATSGPSGLPQVLPVMLFKKLGIPSDRVRFVSVGGHSARLQAVMAGKADAAIVNEVTALIGERAGSVHIVSSVSEQFPHLGYTVLAVKTADVSDASKRRALDILMRHSIRGARYIQANPERSAEILAKYLKDLDPDIILRVVKKMNAQKGWPLDGGVDDDVTTFTAKLEFELGETKTLFRPDQVSEPSIVREVLASERNR
jgi:ABC-type nitrate/sulfonate/bicarbonate transport system substrate-binding protein